LSMQLDERATWDTAYVNNLPDSAFLYIAPGGTKDGDGKTVPRSLRYFPVKDATGKVDVPHVRNALARIPQSNIPQSAKDSATSKAQAMLKAAGGTPAASADGRADDGPPPRENLVRALVPVDMELRADGADGVGTLSGHFAVFDEWTEINSFFEGRFLERFQLGAFAKTFKENRDNIRVLFQHGRDPSVGDKVLGPLDVVEEQTRGAYYEVPLLDTTYNRDLVPGLKAGLYGASFRFKVMQEEFVNKPERSDHNPDGLPERTVTEAKVMELGPVTFPAYANATAGVRSMTDEFVAGHLLARFGDSDPERVRALLAAAAGVDDATAGSEPPAATTQVDPEPEPPAATTPPAPARAAGKYADNDKWEEWLSWTSLKG
jgi:HK97 family phage prohead protease